MISLTMCGYRLPVFDGVTIEHVMDEWYQTFHDVPAYEFSAAVDALKKVKTDTFWPATGELWAQVFEIRKARRVRASARVTEGDWGMKDEDTDTFLAMLRETKDKILGKMAMPKGAPVQEPPDHVLLEREDAKGDLA